MNLYLVPGHDQPVTLFDLRFMFPAVAWANADAGGPDTEALGMVGGSIAPPQPEYDALTEVAVWEDGAWAVKPVPIFEMPTDGTAGGSSAGDYA